MPQPSRAAESVQLVRELAVGPLSVGAIRAGGLTDGRIRAAVRSGALKTLRHGFVVPADDWLAADESLRRRWCLRVATTAWTGAFGSHDTAALLWGLPDYRVDVTGDPPTTHVTRVGQARRDGWIRVHGQDTSFDSTTFLDGLPVTSLIRTSIDMSATRSPRAALVFMDAAMRRAVEIESGEAGLRTAVLSPATRARLFAQWDAAVAPYTRHRWVTQVRLAIRRADPAAETVLESLSRAAMIEADLPLPRCGVPVQGDDGRTYWADALWDDVDLIGEADGLGKYTDLGRVVAEKRRQEALEGNGYRFVRWGMAEVMPSADVMIARIRRALDEARRDASERRYRRKFTA